MNRHCGSKPRLARAGIDFGQGEQVEYIAPSTGEISTAVLPDEIHFDVDKFNKQVITQEFNRVVAEELAKHIDPALPGKTLIFATTDAHADIVVTKIKDAFKAAYGEIDDAAVRKITGSVDRVQRPDPLVSKRYRSEDRSDRRLAHDRNRRSVHH